MESLLQWKSELEQELGRKLNRNEKIFLAWLYSNYLSKKGAPRTRIHANIRSKLLSYGRFKRKSCSSF